MTSNDEVKLHQMRAGLNLRNYRNVYNWRCVGKLRPHLHTSVLGHWELQKWERTIRKQMSDAFGWVGPQAWSI